MDSRPPPPQGAPPPYAFVTRVYRKNLRPVVLSFAFLGAFWTLASGIGFFRNATFFGNNNEPKLHLFSVVLGAMYLGAFGIELFGIFAAFTQKVVFARLFAYLSALGILVIAAVSLLQVVVHFMFKHDIINTCITSSEGETVFFPGFFGPTDAGTLSPSEATDWCNREWNRDSWSEIVSFLITTVLAAFFASVAFAYFRQLLDPTSAANFTREPGTHRMGAFPSHYNPPYGAPGYYPAYAPPAGPPPNQNTDAFVPPYEGDDGKPPGYVRGDDYKGPGYGESMQKDNADDGYAWSRDHEREAGGPSERDVTSRAGANPFL